MPDPQDSGSSTHKVRRVSNSELATFRRCRRKWWLGWYRSLERKGSEFGALHTGTIVHEALRAYYNNLGEAGTDAALARLHEMREAETKFELDGQVIEPPGVSKSYDLANAVVTGYIEWLAETGYDSDVEVVATELPLEAPSPVEGVNLIGKVDLLVRRIHANVLRIRDFKTVQDLTQPVKVLHLDRQMKMYHLLVKLVRKDLHVDGTEWVMLRKSKRTTTAKPPFYGNYEIHHNEEELRLFWQQLHGEITGIMDAERRLNNGDSHHAVAFPNPTKDCSWDCPFYLVCGMLDDPRSDAEGIIAEQYVAGDPMRRYVDTE